MTKGLAEEDSYLGFKFQRVRVQDGRMKAWWLELEACPSEVV